MKETTFTPLKRGRFRCNQTREIVPRRQTMAYRKSRDNEGHVVSTEDGHGEHIQRKNGRKKIIPISVLFWEHGKSAARCPNCNAKNHTDDSGGTSKCKKCGVLFKVVRV